MVHVDRERPVPEPEARPGSDPSPPPSTAKVEADEPAPPSADIQSYIGTQLRAVFDDVANQPVPDRFLELMKRLG